MKPTTLCPCGSGKSQIHCCGDHPKSKINLRSFVTWSFIILLGCGIAAITFSQSQNDASSPTADLTPAPNQPFNSGAASTTFPSGINLGTTLAGLGSTSGSKVPAPPNITNPSPWQYDVATDRHYDSNHAHWHSGPPPADPQTTLVGNTSTAGGQVPAPPNITNPLPWQYDAVTDRHYHPSHAHWHSGSPPTNPSTSLGSTSTAGGQVPAPPNITNPLPWQYDAVTDRHYHPSHAHWHSGSPPTNRSTSPLGSTSTFGSQVPAPTNITDPSPWQYDAVTDRHYNPDHAHWHGGPPPN